MRQQIGFFTFRSEVGLTIDTQSGGGVRLRGGSRKTRQRKLVGNKPIRVRMIQTQIILVISQGWFDPQTVVSLEVAG